MSKLLPVVGVHFHSTLLLFLAVPPHPLAKIFWANLVRFEQILGKSD